MSVILATRETVIRRIAAQSQPEQTVFKTLSGFIICTYELKKKKKKPYLGKTHDKKRAGGVAQGVGSEFKPQYWKKKC
jgi:hypothetical protein